MVFLRTDVSCAWIMIHIVWFSWKWLIADTRGLWPCSKLRLCWHIEANPIHAGQSGLMYHSNHSWLTNTKSKHKKLIRFPKCDLRIIMATVSQFSLRSKFIPFTCMHAFYHVKWSKADGYLHQNHYLFWKDARTHRQLSFGGGTSVSGTGVRVWKSLVWPSLVIPYNDGVSLL